MRRSPLLLSFQVAAIAEVIAAALGVGLAAAGARALPRPRRRRRVSSPRPWSSRPLSSATTCWSRWDGAASSAGRSSRSRPAHRVHAHRRGARRHPRRAAARGQGLARRDGRGPMLVSAARTPGASPLRAFFTVTLPLASRGVVAGCMLGFARSLGDFGVTLMVAGNLPGETRPPRSPSTTRSRPTAPTTRPACSRC